MSHFAVMIIGEDVETQLAPYQENNMGDCPEQFLEFKEDPDCDVDEKTGKPGCWRNPNAKWDWYAIGGRWAGHLLIKPEFASLYQNEEPNFSWGWDEKSKAEVTQQCRVDSAVKDHVDWEGMMQQAGDEAAKRYDFAMQKIGHLPVNEPWIYDKYGGDVDAQKEKYWKQPRCAAWQKIPREEKNAVGIGLFGSPDDFICSREDYIQLARRSAVSVFAFVRGGKWAAKGEMGWFACVSNENDAWPDVFAKLLENVPGTERITIVDCHI